MYVSPDLDAIELRCTLAHELWHVEHGPPASDEDVDNERRVSADTARWLLPCIDTLAETLAVHDIAEASKRLAVTQQVLLDRLGHLDPSERETLRLALPRVAA